MPSGEYNGISNRFQGGSTGSETIVINLKSELTSRGNQSPAQDWSALEIRRPKADDISGIVTVVRSCEPFLTAHMSYIYWMNIHNYGETCAVAELNGELVGWCSISPTPSGKLFLHQLGIAPRARRRGVGDSLLAFLLNRLSERNVAFELEFTIDRKNRAAQNMFKRFAERTGMHLLKAGAAIELLEENCTEELYVMTARERKTAPEHRASAKLR
jgi:L-2,4-diaminobutyric acid acetyltransferase